MWHDVDVDSDAVSACDPPEEARTLCLRRLSFFSSTISFCTLPPATSDGISCECGSVSGWIGGGASEAPGTLRLRRLPLLLDRFVL